jgi:putative oxidoreductase
MSSSTPATPATAGLTPSKRRSWHAWVRIWQTGHGWLQTALNALQPLAALLARLYLAQVFFLSGLTKLRDWDTTVALFQDEYKVPLLPPNLAAVAGTAGEIILPVLLALGLAGRVPALGLFFVNAVAVLSLQEVAPAAMQQHITWGVLAAALALFGGGRWGLDALWAQRGP